MGEKMVRGRKSKWDKPYQDIMRKGSHKSEINRHVQTHADNDDSSQEEIQQQIRAIRKQISRMYKIAKREKRSLTKEEYYEIIELNGIIKKLSQVEDYIKDKPKPEYIKDTDLKDRTTQELCDEHSDLFHKKNLSENEKEIEELDKKIKKIGKELTVREAIKKPKRQVYDADKIIREHDDGTTSVGVTDTNALYHQVDSDYEEKKPTTFIPPSGTNKKIEKFFEEQGEPIKSTTAEEIIKKEQEEKPIKARKQNYKGWVVN